MTTDNRPPPNNMIDRAIEVAARAHQGQVRKATDLPYIAHPYTVGMMLARAGCSVAVIAAGILHDTVEDTYLTLENIREQFGDDVAEIVEGCSEPDKGAPWEVRKKHTLEHLRAAPRNVRVVACADKLHNLRTIREAYEEMGESVWTRFKRGRAEQEWYYRGLAESLRESPGADELPFLSELEEEIARLFGDTV